MNLTLLFTAVTLLWNTGMKSPGNPVISKEDCTCNGKKLYGKIKIVDSFPDLKVKVVESFPDIKIKIVSSFPDECGKWQFVDSFPDLKIQFVESFPDLKIQFVDSFPGMK